MSVEVELFRVIHRSFKKIVHVKSLVKANAENSDIFNVLISNIDELLYIVTNEYERCVRYDVESKRKCLRLAAMQITLIYEKTNAIMFFNKNNDRPDPHMLGSLTRCLQRFETDQLADELFFVYFRALNYLSLAQRKRFNNMTLAEHYLMRAEQMYHSLKQCRQHAFFDCKQLFAKTVYMQPIERGIEHIDHLFMEYLRQFVKIYRSTFDVEKLAKIMELQLKIPSANISNLIRIQEIITLVQLLLSNAKVKSAACYLLIALKMLDECTDSDQKSNGFARVRLMLANAWMNYTFAVLAASTDFIQKMYPGAELELLNKFLPPSESNAARQLGLKPGSYCHKIGDGISIDSLEMTETIEAAIQLSPTELSVCMHSIQQLSASRQLFDHAIDIIDGFIASTDAAATPMDYFIFHYQLFDLLLIRSIFEENFFATYSFLKLRFERCNEMILTLNEECPKIFKITGECVFNDLGDILLDLHLCNVSRSNIATNELQNLKKKLMEMSAKNSTINKMQSRF